MATSTGVKYIGKNDVYEDNILRTGLTWSKGETHILPEVMAKEFLKHPGMFAEVPGASYLIAIPSGEGVAFDEPTTAAIIAIAGDASSGSAAQIVDGYPVEVTGTTEVLVSAVPCDVVWIAHNGVTGTITVRDAGVTGTGIAAAETIDMAATAPLQPGSLRTQFGVTATLTAGKATLWIRPL